MKPITDEEIAALKAAHPGTEINVTENEKLDFRAFWRLPANAWGVWREFREMQGQPGQKEAAHKYLCAQCLVKPTAPEFEALLNSKPGLALTLSLEIQETAGLLGGTTTRKL